VRVLPFVFLRPRFAVYCRRAARSFLGKLRCSNQRVSRDTGMLGWVAGPFGSRVESSRITLLLARSRGGKPQYANRLP
jgi:hypothetical protein